MLFKNKNRWSLKRNVFLSRYHWVSWFAKCENSGVQVQAVLRGLRLHISWTSALYIWGLEGVGGVSVAALLRLIFCTHTAVEQAGWWKCAEAPALYFILLSLGESNVEDKLGWKDLRLWNWYCYGNIFMWSISGVGAITCKETYFQNQGKNWAPVPDLYMSKLSEGSPCYDTCWGKKKKQINKRRRFWQKKELVSILCCILGT